MPILFSMTNDGNLRIPIDGEKLLFGRDDSAYIFYDGTDFNIGFTNPSVGPYTQKVRINDDLLIDGELSILTVPLDESENKLLVIGDDQVVKYRTSYDAVFVDIADAGEYFTTDQVEAALQQLALALYSLTPPTPPFINARDTRTGIDLSQVGVGGAITWDAGQPIGSYEDVIGKGSFSPVSDALSADGVVAFDTSTGDRGGIIADLVDRSGIMNRDVVVGVGDPNPAYPSFAFEQGTVLRPNHLVLELNGVPFDGSGALPDRTVDLTVDTASDTTSGGTQSGLNISAEGQIVFPNGDPYASYYRTGSWGIDSDDMVLGYNYVRVLHIIDGVSTDRESNFADWVVDDDTTATTYSSESLHTLDMTGQKFLSGVEYDTGGTAKFNADIDNAQRNTYIVSNAITFTDVSSNLETIIPESLSATGGDEAQQHSILNKTVTINATRLLNDSIGVKVNTNRTVQTDNSGDNQTISNILMDNATSSSSVATLEDFQDESYRLRSNSDFASISLTTNWDETESLANGGTAGYNDGMLIYNSQIVYPDRTDDSSISSGDFSIANGPAGNPDYSGGACTGEREYYRYFIKPSGSSSTFTMNFNGDGTFVQEGTLTTSSNEIAVSIRLPSQTLWMDCYEDFLDDQWGDGDGCRDASSNPGRNFNDWNLSVGTKFTENSGDRVYIRITVPDNWSGQISNLIWSFD